MTSTSNLEKIFHSIGFKLPKNIKADIEFNLQHNDYINKHFAFLLDLKTNNVICYDTNIYFKSNSFPYSIHAEIQSVVKYYKSKTLNKNKKVLIVVKLSKTGIIGNSKFCLNCSRFLLNNFEALNLKKVYYSVMKSNTLIELSKYQLTDGNFKLSKGFSGRFSD